MSGMTSRERVLAAMRRQTPDRVPFGFAGFSPIALETFRNATGADDPAAYFETDGRDVGFRAPDEHPDYSAYYAGRELPEGAHIRSDCGVASVPGSTAHFTHRISPLENAESFEEIESFPVADFSRPECHRHLDEEIRSIHESGHAAIAHMAQTLFELSWQIRGMENFLTDLLSQPEWAEALMDKYLRLRTFQARRYAEAGADVVHMGDDVGMQTGMMIPPPVWRKIFKPRLAAVVAAAKEPDPDTLVFYHSDGDIREILPDLIEIGIDILNPVQPECMDPAELKRLYGENISFWGTIGTQTTLPFGTPEEVRAVVRERIETVGSGGGLYLAPTHTVEPEVPWENMKAFADAVKEFGAY